MPKAIVKKKARPDSKGRISLGSLAKHVSSYEISVLKNGDILLKPLIEVPKNWLNDTDYLLSNPQNKERLLHSIAQFKAGKYETKELIDE